MDNKKVIILVVLGIGAVFSLIYGATSTPKGRRAATTSASELGDIARQEIVNLAMEIVPVERRARHTKYVTWGKSPFLAKEVIITPDSKFFLGGIVWHEDDPKAIINDEFLGIGAKIDGNTIVDIKQNSVIINDGTKDIEIMLLED